MRPWWRVGVSIATAVLGTAATMPATATVSRAFPAPLVVLVAAQDHITLRTSGGVVLMDPGIRVASLGSPLEFRVWRASYSRPLRITELLHTPSGIRSSRLPRSVLGSVPLGLNDFLDLTVRDSTGAIESTRPILFCPNSVDPERLMPSAPNSSPYPIKCASNPFPLAQVWGVQKDWAVDPLEYIHVPLQLRPGNYRVTETVTPTYVHLLHIPARSATRTVKVTVVNEGGDLAPVADRWGGANSPALRALPQVPDLGNPPRAALPDMVPLPAWAISTSHTRSGQDLLNFGATVWIGGNGPLDVEGFRNPGSPVMRAYQYFWRDGRVIGRARGGTMDFDSRRGHHHWHFEQLARYALLNSAKKLAVRSHKQGFCIAPSDPVDLLLPRAVWQPLNIGLTGQCGSPTSLWVREMLPTGWGDTYFQSVAGQSFNITKVPNGAYNIEVIANPLRVLYEITTANDISLRKVILGGTPGHRTVNVPAWHGIDPES
jgi:hypothetical protein